ncbi:hypothetical protein ACFL6G_00885 [candidate division KSB1 bacterium]
MFLKANKIGKYLIFLSIALLFMMRSVSGQTVNGRLYSSFYSWERQVFGTDPEKYIQLYNGAIVHVREVAGNKNIAFHTYLRFGNVLSGDDLELRNKLYNSYFEWTKIKNRVDISLGRQYIWAGVGNGTLDGGKIDVSMNRWGKMGFYFGTLAPLRESWKIDSWATSHMIGAYYKTRLYDTDMQISWVRKDRKPVSYGSTGIYSGRIINASSLMAHLAGIDLSRTFNDKFTLFMRTEATVKGNKESFIKNDLEIDRFELSGDYKLNSSFMVSGQYFYRNPRQNLNSIFSIFTQSHNQEFWMNLYYYWKSCSVFGGLAIVDYDGDDSQRYNFGFSSKYMSAGMNKYLGYSGDFDNYYFGGQLPVKNYLWLKSNVSLGRYKLYDDAADYNNLVTSSLGVTYKPRQSMSLDIEVQNLKNELTDNDFRIFGRFSYWFFKRNFLKSN